MDTAQKLHLIRLNNQFYSQSARDFSDTRQGFWAGWEKLPLSLSNLRVLDVAAGNLRFKKFLDSKNIAYSAYLGLDASHELLQESRVEPCFYQQADFLTALANDNDWSTDFRCYNPNFVFCNGFFHHISGADWRTQFLRQLWSLVAPSGLLAVSFWQFMTDSSFHKLIIEDLGDNDYLLSWNRGASAVRYCHSYTDTEIDALSADLASHGAQVVSDFHADGKTGHANRYLVWKKSPTQSKILH